MYRLMILIVVLLNYCNRAIAKEWMEERARNEEYLFPYPEKYLFKLAHEFIAMERKYANCRNKMAGREVYTTDSYALRYAVPDFLPKDVVVKVMYRAIYVSARSRESSGFWDLKILPDNLKSEEASWVLKDGELEIMFPYRVPLGTEMKKHCGHITYAVIEVPMGDTGMTSS